MNPIGLFSKKAACACGMTFPSSRELEAHAGAAHAKPRAHACGCGASFPTNAELQTHAGKAHKT